MKKQEQSRRLLSLDALRGADMFFIMGGASIFVALAALLPCGFTEAIAAQMHHVAWDGLTQHDTIFPLFLFIAGVSFPFSLAKQREQGRTRRGIYTKIVRRGLMLVFLGFIYNGLLQFDFGHMRWASVLARIGLGWMMAAMLFVHFRTSVRVIIAAAILVGYWIWMVFIPVPGTEAGPLTFEGNWVGYIDRICLPGQLNQEIFDPEGLLSTLPAIVTAMLGMFTGEFIKTGRNGLTDSRKTLWLTGAGVVLLATGLLLDLSFPINKRLWSSSFVCVVGAYSVWAFALFFYIIDVLQWRRWTFFFKVIGLNSITIYLAQRFINFGFTSDKLFGGIISCLPESTQPLGGAIGYVAVCWIFLYILYRQRIFLKV